MSRGRLTLVLALALALAVGTAELAGAARVHALYSSRPAVRTVAQDGARIAWVNGPCYSVRVRSRDGGQAKVVGNASSVDCGPVVPPRLALAGARALWTNTSAGNNVYTGVMTGAPGQRQRRLEQTIGASSGGDGDYFTDLAGDGSTLVYSTVTMTQLDTCIDPGTPCFYFAESGRVRRVVGRAARGVPDVPPAARLAVWKRRIAVLVATPKGTQPDPTPSGAVEVRDAVSGKLITSFTANGQPLDVALGPYVVVLLERGRCQHCTLIESHSARSGKWLAAASVPNNAADLSISGQNVVFRSGRSIRVLDPVTGDSNVLALASSTPVGLSAEGRWVVWAERLGGRSRIVAVPFD